DPKNTFVRFNRLFEIGRIVLEGYATIEELGGACRRFNGANVALFEDDVSRFFEIEYELTLDGLEGPAVMTEGDTGAETEGSSFQERILHAADGFLHGFQRFTDNRGPDLLGAQVADFFQLKEIVKREGLTYRDEPSALPTGQLSRRYVKDPKYVRSMVIIHSPQASLNSGLLSRVCPTCKYKVNRCVLK
ncbi:MAG TPA: hypothetical protein VF135_09570, partial [Terriglobales bacterium]